ncbi:hypothetical protein JTB14_011912 [Gonioctena quinquepunctata]|nr:hypothetical protein JTB14_011912 [Gonioctena quinquepunctata]
MVLQSGKRFGFEEDDENFTIIENNGNPPDQDYDEEDDLPLARTFQNPVDDLRHILQIVESRQVLDTTGSTTSLNTYLIIREGRKPYALQRSPITSVSFSHDGQCILVSSADDTVRLFDKTSGELLGAYTGHKTEDVNIESAIITDDNFILSGSVTGELWCWDLVSTEVVKKLIHTPGKVLNSLSLHPTKDIVLSSSVGTIKVWGQPDDLIKIKCIE